MSRVITYSMYFPGYHVRAQQPTYFVEKFWKSIWDLSPGIANPLQDYWKEYDKHFPVKYTDPLENIHWHQPKHHTIRAGKRWKAGDMFSPRVWSGKPYHSKQIIIAPDIEIVKTWDFEIEDEDIFLNRRCIFTDIMGRMDKTIDLIAANDGLSTTDLLSWFKYPKPFSGQIICWNKEVNYGE